MKLSNTTRSNVVAIGMGMCIALLMMYDMKSSIDWTDVPFEGLDVRDNKYRVFLAIGAPLVGMIAP